MDKKPTRNDVAKAAGTSTAVVSYVINNSNYVSPEKRAAVEQAIKELNYKPNIYARGLRSNQTRHVALVGDSLQDELFAMIASDLFDHGYYSSLTYSQINDEFVDMLIERRFDGVFMASNSFSAQQLNRIVDNGIHLVLHQSRSYEGLDQRIVAIGPDFYDGIKKSVNYLALKGHKRIGLISPVGFRTRGVQGNDFRTRGYVKAMEDNNLEIIPENVCIHTESVDSICADILNMLSASIRPTALVIGNDYLAAQVMQYLKKLGLRIPEDMAVVGWGDMPYAEITSPQLTTVDCMIPFCAKKISSALLALFRKQIPESERIRVNLKIRESA